MAKVTGLRTWRNGEIINARDYVYERNLISSALNTNDDTLIDHEARITTAEGDITALEGRVTTAETDIDNLQEQEHLKLKYYAKAQENINKGDVVQFYEIQGDHYVVRRARQEDVNANPKLVMGIAETNVTTGNFFYIIDFGFLEGLDTKGQPLGSFVWFDSEGSTPGAWTITEPTGNKARVLLAAIVRAETSGPANNGKFLIRVTIEPSIEDIQGFLITNSQEGDVLRYDASTQTYQNSADLTTAEADIVQLETDVNNLDIDKADLTYVDAHINDTSNPHAVTKAQVGLGNADNTSDLNKPISTATQTALDLKADLVGGKVPAAQLPSYVDDVLEVYERAGTTPTESDWFSLTSGGAALTPEIGKIYVIIAGALINKTYRWGGTHYSIIGEMALGTTAATAFPGDRGLATETTVGVIAPQVAGIISGTQTLTDTRITNSAVATSPLIIDAIASTTARLVDFKLNGTNRFTVASNGDLDVTGFIYATTGLANGSSSNNSRIIPTSTGTIISRNVNDTNVPLIVRKQQGTGNILELQTGTSDKKLEIDVNGSFYQNGERLFTKTGHSGNIFFGNSSGGTGTTGAFNTALGVSSLFALTTGNSNTAVGVSSLNVLTSGSQNTTIGVSSGKTITTGGNNTFVGADSGFNASQLATASNSTALGNGSYTDKSNQMVFGNASVTEFKFDRNASAVALLPQVNATSGNEHSIERTTTGISSPVNPLLLLATSTGDMVDGFGGRLAFQIRDSANVINTIARIGALRSGADNSGRLVFNTITTGTETEKMTILPNGNVGIGTASPQRLLSLVTSSNDDGIQIRRNSATTNDFSTLGFRIATTDTITNLAEIRGVRTNRVNGGDTDLTFTTSTAGANPTEKMRIRDDGNVGIGTSSPTNILSINTGSTNTFALATALNGSINFANGATSELPLIYGKSNINAGLFLMSGSWDGATGGDMVFNIREHDNTDYASLTNKGFVFSRFGTELMNIRRDGLVGINETSPTAQLVVKSGATTRVPLIVDIVASSTASLQVWQKNTVTVASIDNDAYLRIPAIGNTQTTNQSLIEFLTSSTRVSRNVADSNPALIVNLANASATGNIQVWQKAGVAKSFVNNSGEIGTTAVLNSTSFQNSLIGLETTGTLIYRSSSDSNAVLKVRQNNTSTTGDLQQWILGTSTIVASVNKDGIANFTGTPSNAQTVDYTLVLADKGKVLRINSATNRTVTIPLNSSVLFPIDTEIAILRYGTGTVSISPTAGVTLESKAGERKISGQYGSVALKKIGTDEWVLVGSLEA